MFNMDEQLQISATFSMMQERINEWAKRKGWNDQEEPQTFGDLTSLFHSEITEMFEEYRDGRELNEIWFNENKELPDVGQGGMKPKPEGIPIEMADQVIRFLHHFGERTPHLNLGMCIILKMDYNELRPHRHGGKKV